MKTGSRWMMVLATLIAASDADTRRHDWNWSEPRWQVMHEGLNSDAMRIEKAAYDLDASILLSRRCVGFALPPATMSFFGGAEQATVQWRVDGRKTRTGVFVLSPTRRDRKSVV